MDIKILYAPVKKAGLYDVLKKQTKKNNPFGPFSTFSVMYNQQNNKYKYFRKKETLN